MDRCHETQIGSTIERVVDVDVDVDEDEDDTGWGNQLRIRIEIPLNNTLARGRFVTLKDESL